MMVLHIIEKWSVLTGSKFVEMLLACSGIILLFLPLIAFFIYLLKLDCFHYTHYPMRFNRKTGKVHVFVEFTVGRLITVAWKDLYFVQQAGEGMIGIVAHQLSSDRRTVLETFALPSATVGHDPNRFLQWEFVRQYMTGDDKKVAELAGMIEEVMDVAERRETFYASFRRIWAEFAGQHLHLALLFSPLILIVTLGRIIAMHTCKIPRWPDEIEAECQIEPDDPNIRDGKHLVPRGEAPYPDVSAYMGR